MKKNTQYWIRKSHRYLGIFIGVQFLFWTLGGLYFSWTDIDDIHGDHFKIRPAEPHFPATLFTNIQDTSVHIEDLEFRIIKNEPYFWINNRLLINANTGMLKDGVDKQEAISIANQHLKSHLRIKQIEKIEKVGKHHEYRGRPLPAWVISYEGSEHLKAYISINDGNFQRVRHRAWRNFDFLWMLHTMDYNGRDDFNNWLLRAFSILGLITITSGFLLYYFSSPTIRKLKKKFRYE